MLGQTYRIAVIAAALLLTLASRADFATIGADDSWLGKRIVMLHGLGEFHRDTDNSLVDAVGVNIVTAVARVEGDRLWIKSTGEDESGWIEKKDAMLLDDAAAYFNAEIHRNPVNWDSYLRRAEVEHALNQREASLADYTNAIRLHPGEAFLFLRRGRHQWTMRNCAGTVADYDEALRLSDKSVVRGYDLRAEVLSLKSGVYTGCPDQTFRDPAKAVALAQAAADRAPDRPTLLSILAAAYASSGNLQKAAEMQKQALDSPRFPPAYREQGLKQLRAYEKELPANPND